MTDLVFHRAEKYIEEDLEYYFSGERDIHSQVKPGEDIYSFVPDSQHMNFDYNDGKVGNLFFPFAPGTLDRVYIGISFPLFANNWGAAFLRYLMTLVKPDGCVVLPVYPEMQASEKNYWARSILENIFISRSRWKGMSNIWAENDGVMSMRIGRKMPPVIDSTANYLLKEATQAAFRHKVQHNNVDVQETLFSIQQQHWQNMQTAAIVERIIQDHFGRKGQVHFASLGKNSNNTALAIELTLSPYISIEAASSQIAQDHASFQTKDLLAYHARALANRLSLVNDTPQGSFHVVTLINTLSALDDTQRTQTLQQAWQQLKENGLMVVYEEPTQSTMSGKNIHALLTTLGSVSYYSAIAASEHQPNVEISHYSLLIEQELRQENDTKEGVYWVIRK